MSQIPILNAFCVTESHERMLIALTANAFVLPGLKVSMTSTVTLAPTLAAARTRAIVCDEGTGALGGAVLGSLLAGPFGAVWGASIGASVGANSREKKAAAEWVSSLGLTQDTLRLARRCAQDLEEAERSLSVVRTAESSQRALVSTLEEACSQTYARAQSAVQSGDEAAARRLLVERQELKARAVVAQVELAAAEGRVATMQTSVVSLAERASAIEATISRAAMAATAQRVRAGAVELVQEQESGALAAEAPPSDSGNADERRAARQAHLLGERPRGRSDEKSRGDGGDLARELGRGVRTGAGAGGQTVGRRLGDDSRSHAHMETPSIRQEQTLSAYYGLAVVVICVIVVDVAETEVELLFTVLQVMLFWLLGSWLWKTLLPTARDVVAPDPGSSSPAAAAPAAPAPEPEPTTAAEYRMWLFRNTNEPLGVDEKPLDFYRGLYWKHTGKVGADDSGSTAGGGGETDASAVSRSWGGAQEEGVSWEEVPLL